MRPISRRAFKTLLSLLAPAILALGVVPAAAAAAAETKPSISLGAGQSLDPGFSQRSRDYVARCGESSGLNLEIGGAKGWEVRVDRGRYTSSDFEEPGAGPDAVVSMRRAGAAAATAKPRRFHLRCLPGDFPEYEFDRRRAGGPKLFTMQLTDRYAAIFNRDGVPIWWFQAGGEPDDVQVLRNGTVSFAPVDSATLQSAERFEIRNLKGRLLRTVTAGGGGVADIHELLVLPNGNYVIGTPTERSGVDASPYGGSPDGGVLGIDIQEITPKGKVVWSWSSADHIGLEETGRWWASIRATEPYDIVHWNSVDISRDRVLLSFRHLDAVYAIDRSTGEVEWKLGGTETAASLRIVGDPEGSYPFGGQHDARFEPDGAISIFDNDTGLEYAPRAVRYEIDEEAGTAKLIETVTDPDVPASFCCGSARRLSSEDWLISWGGTVKGGVVGAYDERGRTLFKLTTPGGFPYRALPVDERFVTNRELRRGMSGRRG